MQTFTFPFKHQPVIYTPLQNLHTIWKFSEKLKHLKLLFFYYVDAEKRVMNNSFLRPWSCPKAPLTVANILNDHYSFLLPMFQKGKKS